MIGTLLIFTAMQSGAPAPSPAPSPDIAAARAVFEQNVGAIRQRDRERYLSWTTCTIPVCVRGGPSGFTTGFDEFAKGAGLAAGHDRRLGH